MLAAAGWDTLPVEAPLRFPEFAWGEPWLADVRRVLLPSEPYAFSARDAGGSGCAGAAARTRVQHGEMVSWDGSRAIAGMRHLAELRRQLA